MKRSTLSRILAAREARESAVLLTWLADGDQRLVEARELDRLPSSVDAQIATASAAALRTDQARIEEVRGDRVFVQPLCPPLRMAIVGAVHIAQHLAHMARCAGYEVIVMDPRTAFATTERFPGVTLRHDEPEEALEEIAPDARTAIVALSHDPKFDDPALVRALASPSFYVGALGSRRSHARRLERLAQLGVSEAAQARIHGPIGLDIGARSPAEIAVSILAQVTDVLRRTTP